jgi:hypothetical protein
MIFAGLNEFDAGQLMELVSLAELDFGQLVSTYGGNIKY